MKRLALALLLLATPAFAGGICNDFTAAPVTFGTSEATLWTKTIAAGSIGDGNAFDVDVTAQGNGSWSQSGNVNVYLNGIGLGNACATASSLVGTVRLRIQRVGSDSAWVSQWRGVEDMGEVYTTPQLYEGFAWGSAQTLALKGISNENGGGKLLSACVRR